MIEVLLDDLRWRPLMLESLAERAVGMTLGHLDIDVAAAEVSLLGCDDARIADLNAAFRDKSGATNVLSWPSEDLAPERPGGRPIPPEPDPDGTLALGDIAIAFETCEREAREMGKTMDAHVTHLLVHGTLHLLGYDHERDADATLMQRLETEILGKMGLDDPYVT